MDFIFKLFKSFRNKGLKILEINEELSDCDVLNNDFAIDGSFVLDMYGIRKSRDIDFMVSDNANKFALQKLGSRSEQIVFHSVSKSDLIYDPKYYFYLNGIKIISLASICYEE